MVTLQLVPHDVFTVHAIQPLPHRFPRVFQSLGLLLNPDKTVGLSTSLIVLGIELDTMLQIARLPAAKVLERKRLLRD